jgi:hypothetical protein
MDAEGHTGRESNLVFHTVSDITSTEPRPVNITSLHQNYPNPFNPVTTIEFTVGGTVTSPVRLEIFDVSGRRVATILEKTLAPGSYAVRWSGRGESGRLLASGVYFMRLSAGDTVASRKMILLR